MTSERVSDERLAEMLADTISERDRPIIGDGSLYDFHPGELVIALTELQSLRSAREAEQVGYVEVGTFIASSEHGVGVTWGDLGPLGSGDKLYARDSHPSPSTEGLGIERAARIIARDCGGDNYGEDDWGVFVHVARSILSALSTSAEQVEITDEMVERARHAHADARDFGWDYVAAMRAAITAALSPSPKKEG